MAATAAGVQVAVVAGSGGEPWRGAHAGVRWCPPSGRSVCAGCRAPLAPRTGALCAGGTSHRRLPPLLAGANTLPPGSWAPPSNSKRTTTPRVFYWTEKAAGVGAREHKCPRRSAEDRALPGPPTCRRRPPRPLRGRIRPETLGKLPLETRHLGHPHLYPKKHPFAHPHRTTTTK